MTQEFQSQFKGREVKDFGQLSVHTIKIINNKFIIIIVGIRGTRI